MLFAQYSAAGRIKAAVRAAPVLILVAAGASVTHFTVSYCTRHGRI